MNRRAVRFSGDEILQCVEMHNCKVAVTTLQQGRKGLYVTNSLAPHDLQAALHRSAALARAAGSEPGPDDFPPPRAYSSILSGPQSFPGPGPLLKLAARILKSSPAPGLRLSGCLWQQKLVAAVCNSAGVWAYAPHSCAGLTLSTRKPNAAGYAQSGAQDLNALDTDALITEALSSCRGHVPHSPLKAGKYPVVLSSYALAELLSYLNYLNFAAGATKRGGSSPGKAARPSISPAVTIMDDAFDTRSPGLPFDFEGTPRSRVKLVVKGRFTAGVSDRESARRLGSLSTGHAVWPESGGQSPRALNLVMAHGKDNLASLYARAESVLAINRLHYIRPLHNSPATVAGMTRDGILRLNQGEISGLCPDMRFTLSLIDIFKGIRQLSQETKTLLWMDDNGFESIIAPAAYIEEFELQP